MLQYSPEMLKNLISHYNEIRFNAQKNGDSIPVASTMHDFSLQSCGYGTLVLRNDGLGNVCLNSSRIVSQKQGALEDDSVFIYDEPDKPGAPPSFLFALDPHENDLWQLDPLSDRGLEIHAENFTRKFFNGSETSGIENLNFTIRASEFVGIYGGSGTGKTTLLESMLAPKEKETFSQRMKRKWHRGKSCESGKILFDNQDISYFSMEIAYLPQKIDLPTQLKCGELLHLALYDRGEKKVISDTNAIKNILALCSLNESILESRVSALSGGQKRRLALAMALLKKKVRLLILDEPTTGLDIENELAVMRTLKRISRHGITVVTVTHSVAACRMFDRVLILRKTFPDKGAALCFKSMWTESSFNSVLNHMSSDAERLSFLANPSSGLLLGENQLNEQEYLWPFASYSTPEQQQNITKATLIQRIQRSISNCFSRSVYRQIFAWRKAGSHLICRDKKSLKSFVYLAIVCVLIVQFGIVKNLGDGNSQLISLLSICAPWLCATYAAIFLCENLTFFAWEKISGLKAWTFVIGIFGAQLLPAVLLAFIFTAGIYFRVNHGVSQLKSLNWSEKIYFWSQSWYKKKTIPPCQTSQTVTVNKEKCPITENSMQCPVSKFFIKFIKTREHSKIFQAAGDASEAHIFMKPLGTVRDYYPSVYNRKGVKKDGIETKKDPSPSFYRVCFAMLFSCLIGSSLGILFGAYFKKTKSATVGLVVVFIFFLIFGRLFMGQAEGFLEPISVLCEGYPRESGKLDLCTRNEFLPIVLSFFSISRYIFNLIAYPVGSTGGLLHEAMQIWYFLKWDLLLLFLFLCLPLLTASVFLTNKSKIWKLISR